MGYETRLAAADVRYWARFIESRRSTLSIVGMELEVALNDGRGDVGRLSAALRSLDAASDQLARLSPDLCVDYLDAWMADLHEWEWATQRLGGYADMAAAMAWLGLREWYLLDDRLSPGHSWRRGLIL